MKKFFWVAMGFLTTVGAFAQNPVVSFSHYGNLTVDASATEYVYTRGGSPRTGFYYYWRAYPRQNVSQTASIPAPGTTGLITALGTYFSPNYSASADAKTAYVAGAATTTYSAGITASTVFAPVLAPHQAATVSEVGYDYAYFTVDVPTYVTIAPHGAGGSIALYDTTSGEAIFSSTGTGGFADTIDPGTYEIILLVNMNAGQNTQTGVSQNLGSFKSALTYTATFAAG